MQNSSAIQPYGAVQYLHLRQDGFTETGADSINLQGDAVTADSFRGFLGTELERSFQRSFGVLTPKVQVAWMHEFGDTHQASAARFAGAPADNGSFVIQGVDSGRDWLLAGAELHLSLHSSVTVFGGYNGQYNQNHALHTGSGGLEYRW
ncbi:MAG: autotransporter outer membrane beta-barrel domain-containing protein [Pirellulaceae bacterium]